MLIYKPKIDKKYLIQLEEYSKELQVFFGVKPKLININIFEDIKSFGKAIERETPSWMVGFAKNHNIFVLNPSALEKESTHKKEEFIQILKHEICHIFVNNINSECLLSLDEGLSLCFAKQDRTAVIKKKNFDNFFGPLNFYVGLNSNEFSSSQGYQLSYMMVNNILSSFSQNQIIDLIKISRKDRDWEKKIESITGKNIVEYKKILEKGIKIN